MCLTQIFLQVMHDAACYKAIPDNTTNCLLLNYTWTDADGCLEHQGGCYAGSLTVLDGGIKTHGSVSCGPRSRRATP